MLITWFELSRVKLYRNELKGNKNYFELAGGSSYRGFELSRVRVAEGKITVNVRRKSRGNRLWFELARGSSYVSVKSKLQHAPPPPATPRAFDFFENY